MNADRQRWRFTCCRKSHKVVKIVRSQYQNLLCSPESTVAQQASPYLNWWVYKVNSAWRLWTEWMAGLCDRGHPWWEPAVWRQPWSCLWKHCHNLCWRSLSDKHGRPLQEPTKRQSIEKNCLDDRLDSRLKQGRWLCNGLRHVLLEYMAVDSSVEAIPLEHH